MSPSRRLSTFAFLTLLVAGFSGRAPAQIDLGDIVAGGDGTGTAPAANLGLDPRNGAFVTGQFGGTIRETDAGSDGLNPSPVGSDLVDSVFIIGPADGSGEPFSQAISQTGTIFDFPAADAIGTGWNFIFKDLNAGGGAPLSVGNVTTWTGGIGIHASTGVTFDLLSLRAVHGEAAVGCFSAVLGMDQCGGDVILYAILSNDDGLIGWTSARATQHSAEAVRLEIPADAAYLTLATGSNGPDGCDHGNFAEATISEGACSADIAALEIAPATRVLSTGQSVAFRVTSALPSGITLNLTAALSGTTYSVQPAGIVQVSPDGVATALANGSAEVTATNGALSATATVIVQDFIDLGNVVAGGDGKLPPPAGIIGINADTGAFVTARAPVDVNELNGVNPQPVDGSGVAGNSEFIDSVFVMTTGVGQVISTTGTVFDFDAGDVAQGWESILSNREPDGPDWLEIAPAETFYSGIGIHAAQGITFDLDSLRAEHGAAAVRYARAFAGETSRGAGGRVNAYLIVSDEEGPIDSRAVLGATDRGEFVELEIPADARFLTLASGAAGDGIGGDHGAFGLASIAAAPIDVSTIAGVTVRPEFSCFASADTAEVAIEVVGVLTTPGFAGAPIRLDPASLSYSSADPSVAEVDALGRVTPRGDGRTSIDVTVGGETFPVDVLVGSFIELSDITAGGDGTGTAVLDVLGVDPRNGAFVTTSNPVTLLETDAEGDGVNPSPVDDSELIDAVFLIGPNDAGGDPYSQAITSTGVAFDFPAADAIGTGWNYIFKDQGGGGVLPIRVGGTTSWFHAVGIHASAGITYDLEAIRSIHGENAVAKFLAYWGVDDRGTADINLYAILSSGSDVIDSQTFPGATVNSGELVEMEIPPDASFLTLAVGSNGIDACDHGVIAEAIILPGEGTGPITFHRADPTGDGSTNITDGIFVLNYLFIGGPAPSCLDSADGNDDGSINITDGIYILNYLFLGGPAPVTPGGTDRPCGPDGTADALGCVSYPPCR